MPAQPRYCAYCGAANTAEDTTICFSCQQPLTFSEEDTQAILLHERYRLLTQVGAGGFGGVYRALDMAEGARVVAIKQINLHGLSAQEVIEATDGFNREVHLLSNLRHPNLPSTHDTFTDPEHWYVVMDFIEGETLEAYLKRQAQPSLPLREVLALGLQLCTVLGYLHTREPQIIFRDLKPSNVMRTANGQIYLIDFGIARHFTPGKPKDTMPFGSPGYAAPEQYGRMQTTPQADIYSLGALLHQMLTGHDPAESPFRFTPLPGTLATLNTLIQRMVATEPDERPASVFKVKAILQRLADERTHETWQITASEAARLRPVPLPAPIGFTRRGLIKGVVTLAAIGGIVTVCSTAIHISGPHVAGTIAMPPPSPGVTKKQFVYRGHTGAITALSWSPDGQYVASGSADKTVQVWRAVDGVLLYTLSGYDDPVTSIVWATDRTNVIASSGMSDGTVQVWDALRDHRDLIYHGDGRTLALAWRDRSPWIASGGTDQTVYTWSADTGQKGASYSGHTGDVRAVVWLSSPQQQGIPNERIPITTPTATPAPGATPTPPATPTPSNTIPRNLIASGGADSTVQMWDASTGEHVYTYVDHTAGINGLALFYGEPQSDLSPTAIPNIISASDDGTVQVWNLNAQFDRTVYHGHNGKVNAIAVLSTFIPYYGQPIVSAGEDQTVQIWSIHNRQQPLNTYREHQAPVRAVATSPIEDDRRIVSGDDNGLVHMWTLSSFSY